MAIQIRTEKQIIEDLNKGLEEHVWIPLPGFVSFNTVDVLPNEYKFNAAKGLIIKVFFNIKTAELKAFLAKFLDVGKDIP
jgi:hypothetical protein